MHGSLRRSIALVAAGSLALAQILVGPVPEVHASSPEEDAIAAGLRQLTDTLTGVDALDELGEALPFTDLLPTGPDGLDVADVMNAIDAAIAGVGDKTAENVEGAINLLNGTVIGGAATLNVNIDIDVGSSSVTFNTLSLTRTVNEPLNFLSGDPTDPATFDLSGGDLTVELELSFTPTDPFVLGYDTNTDMLFIDADPAPTATFSATIALAGSPIAGINFGILEVSAAGTVAASIAADVVWLDPDVDGFIRMSELTNSAASDLFDIDVGTASGDMVLDLTAESSLPALQGLTGSIELHDTNVYDGLPTPTVNMPELGNFANLTPEQILISIAQLALSLQAMQTRVGVADIPLLGADPNAGPDSDSVENLADVIDLNAAIGDWFVAQGFSSPENPLELKIGDTNNDGIVDVPLGDDFDDLEGILNQLFAQFGDVVDLDYDDATDSILFDLTYGESYDPPAAVIRVDDALAGFGLRGLVNGGGTASVDLSASYDVSLGFGINLEEAPDPANPLPLTDRLFIETQGTEVMADADLIGDLALTGALGFLEVSLTDTNAGGGVDLLGKRAGVVNEALPMLSIDLDGGTDNVITLTDLFDQLGALSIDNPAPDTFVLESGDDITLTGVVNVAVPDTTVNVNATIGTSQLAGATVTFGWPDILDSTPTFDAAGTWNDDFAPFNFDTDNPLALFNSIIDLVDQAVQAVDSLDSAALDTEIPIIGTSIRDAAAFLDDVRAKINEFAQDPAGSLQRLEHELELAIAQGLGIPNIPVAPDPNDPVFLNDAGTGAESFDEAQFQAALTQYLTDVQTFVGGVADFIDIGYLPGNSPGAVGVSLSLGICSDDTNRPDCTYEMPLDPAAFNFDLTEFAGAPDFASLNGDGEATLDYGASIHLEMGVELPDVAAPGYDPLVDLPRPFVTDNSRLDLDIAGEFTGEFGATLGPFAIQIGEQSDATPETGLDCENNVDDDGDNKVNDGCVAVGDGPVAEAGAECDNDTDDDTADNDPAATAVNDGCPAVAAPLHAGVSAAFAIETDLDNDNTTTRAYLFGADSGAGEEDFEDLLAGLVAGISFEPGSACAPTQFVCATLPLYIVEPTVVYLGAVGVEVTDLDPFTGAFTGDSWADITNTLIANADNLAWALIGQGLEEFGNYVEEATKAAAYDVEIPVIGDALDAGAALGTTFNNDLVAPIATFLQNNAPTDIADVESSLKQMIVDAVGGPDGLLVDENTDGNKDAADITFNWTCTGGVPCDIDQNAPDNIITDIIDVNVHFGLGDVIADTGALPFDFGFPGLRIATVEGQGATASLNWNIYVGFGLSLEDGFYLMTNDDPTLGTSIDLTALVNTPDLEADIAFLGIDIDGDKAKPGGRQAEEVNLSLDINVPDDGSHKLSMQNLSNLDPTELLPALHIDVDLFWGITTAPDFGGAGGEGSLPTLKGDLDLTWGATLSVDGFDMGDLDVAFENMQLDMGTFISEFLGPILAEVQKFTKPLQPIIDVVSAPIPGISQLAELVGADPITMITLFEAISGNDLTLLETLLDVISFINAIDTNPTGPVLINIGRFDLDSGLMLETELPANQKDQLISNSDAVGGIVDAMNSIGGEIAAAFNDTLSEGDELESDEPGFSFPAFEDFGNLFQLLVGKDVTLVRWASGPLKAEFGFSQSFGPIAVGPIPVSIVISGSASIEGRFAVGYDTKGIRQLVQMLTDDDSSNDDFLSGFGFLFNGLFLDDLNSAGQDVPEIRLVVEFAAGAAVDLVIVSAGVEGGVRATLDLNLHDGGFFEPIPPENLDGKLRIDEVASFLFSNPLCLFDVSGKLEAFIRIFVEIDLFLYSARFEFTVINITLLEMDNILEDLCRPPDPVLATDIGDRVLRLNIGPNDGARGYATDDDEEKYVVRQLNTDVVEVSAYGFIQVYEDVDRVVGDAGAGKDSIRFDEGTREDVNEANEVTEVQVPFVLPTRICGGPGDDKLFGAQGQDRFFGDGFENGLSGLDWDCDGTEVPATDGLDQLSGLGASDNFTGGGQNDQLVADNGNDTVNGGSGDDQMDGGTGEDTMNGGDGADSIRGGADHDPNLVPDDPDIVVEESDDTINGDGGNDTIDSDFGADVITGGTGNDVIVSSFGDDNVHGNENEDQVYAGEGADDIAGDAGDDLLLGELGDDDILGGSEDDNIIGAEGNDDVDGEGGKDVILGDVGEIHRAADPLVSNLNPDAGFPLVVRISSAGGAGDVTLSGGDDTDVIHGQEGDDTIEGGGGDDDLHGQQGADSMSGDGGADTMFGDANVDEMYGDNASASNGCSDLDDTMHGGDGDDTMSGNADADNMFGDAGADLMYGDAATPNEPCDGIDTMFGAAGNDYMFGNGKADIIRGDGDRDRIVGGSIQADELDEGDDIDGGALDDVIAGDNATIGAITGGNTDTALVTLRIDDEGALFTDLINGSGGDDRMYGEAGDDTINGGDGNDAAEGNQGEDTISGNDGDDDLVGGGSANDGANGIVDTNRAGDGLLDVLDHISGNNGDDWIAGDNALINRNFVSEGRAPVELFDVEIAGATQPNVNTSGADVLNGDADEDEIFGQGKGDTITGGLADDYIEGNHGDDDIKGNEGDDDLVGGGSANDGEIDSNRVGNTLEDGSETLIQGNDGVDWITGDNALISRVIPSGAAAPIILFDVQLSVGTQPHSDTSGGDYIEGNDGEDQIFGQGNGSQPLSQTDPDDDRNNDYVAYPVNVASSDFDRATGTTDEDVGGWAGDVIKGGADDDYIEGNHGNDLIFGNGLAAAPASDDDDITGGGSADDGLIDATRLNLGANLRDGADTIHGDSGDLLTSTADDSFGDDDAIAGDNAWIARTGSSETGEGPEPDGLGEPIEVDITSRNTQVFQTVTPANTFGNDFLAGNGGHDEIFGEGGDDAIEGGYGSDALIGDLGKVTTDLLGAGSDATCPDTNDVIQPNEPFISEVVCVPGTIFRLVQLYAFDDTQAAAVVAGNDVLLGLDGDDWLHGGPGVDLLNGDGDGGAETVDDLGIQHITDPNPGSQDYDRIFGGDSLQGGGAPSPVTGGSGDVIWGGRGHDHGYGGRGDDMLDVRPDDQYPLTWKAWGEGDVESYHEIDYHYGGKDQDILQANVAENGNQPGDRLLDWVGVYNLYLLCPASYGGYVPIRDQSPGIIPYLQDQARYDGVFQVTTSTASGYNELAMVFKPDVKDNANPVYPGTPGHKSCG